MDQAEGAIEAARAAGAERYAPNELASATNALQLAHDAVAQRDYRLALNHALESREQAQNAARQAADTHARVRGEAERSMAEVAALLAQAEAHLAAAESARVPRRVLTEARTALETARTDVQEAREAMNEEDYAVAQPALDGLKTRIEAAIATLDEAMSTQSSRRRG